MKINEIPFFRDNGWIFMPIAYLALIALVILIYFNINSSHHNSSYNVGSVDDVTINEIVTEKKAIYKFIICRTFYLFINIYIVTFRLIYSKF